MKKTLKGAFIGAVAGGLLAWGGAVMIAPEPVAGETAEKASVMDATGSGALLGGLIGGLIAFRRQYPGNGPR